MEKEFRGKNMSKREQINDLIEAWNECDDECDDCFLANYIDIFGTQHILCSVVQQIWKAGIEAYKKENNIK